LLVLEGESPARQLVLSGRALSPLPLEEVDDELLLEELELDDELLLEELELDEELLLEELELDEELLLEELELNEELLLSPPPEAPPPQALKRETSNEANKINDNLFVKFIQAVSTCWEWCCEKKKDTCTILLFFTLIYRLFSKLNK